MKSSDPRTGRVVVVVSAPTITAGRAIVVAEAELIVDKLVFGAELICSTSLGRCSI